MIGLAVEKFGRTPRELMESLSSAEFSELMAYFQNEYEDAEAERKKAENEARRNKGGGGRGKGRRRRR